MIEVVSIDDLKRGDIILLEGTRDGEVCIATVDKKPKDGLIIPREFGGLDYAPEDPDAIVRIGTSKDVPRITLMASKMNLSYTREWEKILEK
ncbi:MAG: hypothetical protein AABY15_02980 [Nanoarchaeota archaeon]